MVWTGGLDLNPLVESKWEAAAQEGTPPSKPSKREAFLKGDAFLFQMRIQFHQLRVSEDGHSEVCQCQTCSRGSKSDAPCA